MEQTVLTLEQMRFVEDYTCNEMQVSTMQLIQRAGVASAKTFIETLRPDSKQRIIVFSGPHNNGLDAFEMSEELFIEGFQNLLLLSISRSFEKASFPMKTINDESDLSSLDDLLAQTDFIVDGIFGTGINRDVEGFYQALIEAINQSHKLVYSIDIPSGINGHNGLVMGSAVKAAYTGVIGAYKTGNLLGDALDYSGEMTLISIDLQFDEIKNPILFIDHFLPKYPERKHRSHKYDYGNVLTIGGSFGMFGAVSLASFAALRTGSGLSSIALCAKDAPYYHPFYPEVILNQYDSIETFQKIIEKKDAFLFGPGMETNSMSKGIFDVLLATHKPIVVDGGAIPLLKECDLFGNLEVITTPHVGELAKCVGVSSQEVLEDPFKFIDILAKKGITVVLKGAMTIIRNLDRTIILKSGNPGMATAGMGDVLSGMILSYVGRKVDPLDAALYGVSVHSMAGNLASVSLGEESLVASDLFHTLPQILNLGEKQ